MKKLNLGIAQPKYDLIAKRIEFTAHLSMAKMLAHVNNPSVYPMTSDNKALENILLKHFQIVRKKSLQKLSAT